MRPTSIRNLSTFLVAVSSFSDLTRLVPLGSEPSLTLFTFAIPHGTNTSSFEAKHDEHITPDTLTKHAKRMVEYDPPRRHDHRRNPHYHPHFRHPHLHPAYGGTSGHDEHDSEQDEHGSKESGAEEAGHGDNAETVEKPEEENGHPGGHATG
jgi:hypothetical protein